MNTSRSFASRLASTMVDAAAEAAQRQTHQGKKQTTSTKRAKKAFVTDPAVKIPHDGPIYHRLLLQAKRVDESSQDGNVASAGATDEAGSPSQGAALGLLSSLGSNDDNMNVSSGQSEASTIVNQLDEASRKLLGDLHNATDVQNQLAALRSYRSSVLHILTKEADDGDAKDSSEGSDTANTSNAPGLIGTYRILVELSLSMETPVAVARAVRSSLDAVRGSIDATLVDDMHKEVAQSIILASSSWADPIFTMFQALGYDPPTCTHVVRNSSSIQSALEVLLQSSHDIEGTIKSKSFRAQSDAENVAGPSALELSQAVDRGTEVACTLKLIMAQLLVNATADASNNDLDAVLPTLDSILESLLLPLLACTATSTDSLSKIGVVLGQVWLYKWFCGVGDVLDVGARDEILAQSAAKMLHELTGSMSGEEWITGLPDLNTLSAVRGIAATLPDPVLLQRVNDTVLLRFIGSYLLHLCNHSTDPAVRLSAIRGLDTVLTRVASILRSESAEKSSVFDTDLEEFVKDSLDVALGTWSNSSSRQVSCAVPGLFKSVISVMRTSSSESMSIDAVILRVLEQPTNRKGRYIALEALLKDKTVGAKLFELGGGSALIQSFIEGISDSESVARPIADLMGKLLCSVREEMNAKAGIIDLSNPAGSKKDRRKRERQLAREREQGHVEAIVAQPQLLPDWIELWADPVARAMLSPVHRRRTRVADFCLPMLETMSGGPTRRIEMSYCFAAILEKLNRYSGPSFDVDRVLWAKLEVVKQARNQKMTKASVLTENLQTAIADAVPRTMLQSALTHNDSTIHLAAFSTLDALLPSYTSDSTPATALDLISQELDLWRGALPYASKCNGKEHVTQMMKCLDNILVRASNVQAESQELAPLDGITGNGDGTEGSGTDIVAEFCDFLIGDLFVRNGSYPGTVADKEAFALPLASCILSFACDGKIHSKSIVAAAKSASDKPKKRSKNKGVTNRKLSPGQLVTRENVLRRLVSTEVFGSILSLLHSMWDRTRSLAYELCCDLINQALLSSIPLPSAFTSSEGSQGWQARAFHLASSPRQREADTGGRMLSVLYAASSPKERESCLENIVTIASERIDTMAAALSGDTSDQQPLPLAYGLLQALRLMLEQNKALFERDALLAGSIDDGKALGSVDACVRVAGVASRAIQTSLAIVADIKKSGEGEEEGDEDIIMGDEAPAGASGKPTEEGANDSATPLNVNTGAIGANAVYSSIKASDEEAEKQRYALQRVIVGSWLLMKEACAALCMAIVEYPESPPSQLVEDAGSLLITAMVSLKHQGAAFAAHNALQQIALKCNSFEHLLSFPDQWATRILYEISAVETVRDSTLRRSTGYALGLLSLMRTQPSLASSSSTGLCQSVLAEIVRFSFPSAVVMNKSLAQWAGNVSTNIEDIFVFSSLGTSHLSAGEMFVSDESYEIRTRVHALNILRLAILDAPLAPVTNKIIGDAFISAIIGYSDPSWRVRSSATMVFAAAMLRVDANKNASALPMDKKEESKTSGTAITAVELFRCYPALSHFLLTSLTEGIGAAGASSGKKRKLEDIMFKSDASSDAMDSDHLHPALFPVLLLLSRLQPVSQTPSDSDATQQTDPFVELVLLCLKHKHHKVRVMASRAISVLCSGDNNGSISSRDSLLRRCSNLLGQSVASDPAPATFNAQHGLLLGIQALLLTSTRPEILFQDKELSQNVSYFATWANGSLVCPPLSTKIALEILGHCESARRANAGGKDLSEEYIRTVYSAVRATEIVARDGNFAAVGGAQLGIAAGKLACEVSFDIIFSSAHDAASRTDHIDRVGALLSSYCYDVRIHAAKAFKKRIWSKADDILADTSAGRQERAELMAPVCTMLMNALQSEMSRNQDANGLGAHPPTLRRISRCAIECLMAHRSLVGHHKVPLATDAGEKLWNMLMDMRELGREAAIDDEEASAGTSLAGNAVELLAFVVSSEISEMLEDDATFNEKASAFVDALSLSTDPNLNWVVRHSAAVAVGSSGILTDAFSGEDPARKQMRLKAYLSVLTFLQDSDSDVRDAAGRSLSTSLDDPANSASLRTDGHVSSRVPLMELEMAYHKIGERHYDDDGLANHLAASISHECQESRSGLDLALSEFNYSEHCEEASKLLNQDTTRKIFEAEDSNPYSESLATCQLSTSLIAQCSICGDGHEEVWGVMSGITSECSSILQAITARASTKASYATDMAHNLTWSSDGFPTIHNVLLGSIVSVYLGCHDGSTVINDAKDLLRALGTEGRKSIHPCIQEALVVLSEASTKDEATKAGLLRACFLVPSVCHNASM